MKRFLSVLLMIHFFCSYSFSQDRQLATLQHGADLQVFYGLSAFKSAMAAAVDGDIITLSAGTFTSENITKAVTIQGAGYVNDQANGRFMTNLSGDLSIVLPEGAKGVKIEGVNNNNAVYVGKATEFIFKRCRFYDLKFTEQSINCQILQCRVGNLYPDKSSENLLLKNSVINVLYENGDNAMLLAENCVFTSWHNSYNNAVVTYKNCILNVPSGNSSSIAYNSISWTPFSASVQQNTVSGLDLRANVIEGNFDWESPLKLKADAATKYIGTDGTQVGIYGGTTPFTDIPSNPQIKSKEIAAQTDENGKLSVKITVEAQND